MSHCGQTPSGASSGSSEPQSGQVGFAICIGFRRAWERGTVGLLPQGSRDIGVRARRHLKRKLGRRIAERWTDGSGAIDPTVWVRRTVGVAQRRLKFRRCSSRPLPFNRRSATGSRFDSRPWLESRLESHGYGHLVAVRRDNPAVALHGFNSCLARRSDNFSMDRFIAAHIISPGWSCVQTTKSYRRCSATGPTGP